MIGRSGRFNGGVFTHPLRRQAREDILFYLGSNDVPQADANPIVHQHFDSGRTAIGKQIDAVRLRRTEHAAWKYPFKRLERVPT